MLIYCSFTFYFLSDKPLTFFQNLLDDRRIEIDNEKREARLKGIKREPPSSFHAPNGALSLRPAGGARPASAPGATAHRPIQVEPLWPIKLGETPHSPGVYIFIDTIWQCRAEYP